MRVGVLGDHLYHPYQQSRNFQLIPVTQRMN